MSCRLITSPVTEQEVQSQTWNDIRQSVQSDEQADQLYARLTTPEFINWFGDWINDPGGESVSKMVTEHGEPKIVYRGAKKGIVNQKQITYWTTRKRLAETFKTHGVMNVRLREDEDGELYVGFLNIQNPIKTMDISSKSIVEYQEKGIDAAMVFPTPENPKTGELFKREEVIDSIPYIDNSKNNEIVIFDPKQIFTFSQDIIQFNRPVTYQEQLDQFKQRWNLLPLQKDGVSGYKMTMAGAQAMAKQYKKSGYLYNKLALHYNRTSGILEITPKEHADYLEMNRGEQEQLVAREIFTKTIQPIADRLGIKFQIITREEAVEITKNAKNPYRGESAFNLNDTAYILDNALTLTNGIHEVIHPLLNAVAGSNQELFNKLYSDFIQTNTGAKIAQEVAASYSDFDTLRQQKEILVRGLTALAKNNIEGGEQEKIKGIFNKLWFAIKQLLRKVFGSTIRVSELNENTTLQQLADMLTSEGFKIETNYISESDILEFNRQNEQLFNDISKLDSEKLDKTIQTFLSVVQSHAGKIINNANFDELKQITTAETGRNQLATFQSMLVEVKKLGDSAEEMKRKVSNLTHVIAETKVITDKILERLKEVSKQPVTDDTIQRMSYFKNMLTDWKQFYDNLTKDISPSVFANSALFNTIGATKHNIDTGLHQINDNNNPALLAVLGDMLNSVKQSLDKDHQQRLEMYNAELQKGNKDAAQYIKDETERYKRFDLSDDNLLKYLTGENGDTSVFSGFLEAAISSPDPIIGGFAKFIKTNLYVVQAKVRDIDVSMRNELAPHYKAAGVNRDNVSQLGSQISFLDTVLKFEDGNPIESKVLTLLSPFKNYRYDIDLLKHKIRQAKEAGNEEDIIQLSRDLDKLERTYMNREFVDEFYQIQDIWKSDIGQKAKLKRQQIFDDIQHLEDTSGKEADEMEETQKAIEDKWKEYKQLAALTDLNGDAKTGEDLEIANLIREYNEKSRPFYEWKEKPGLFETRLAQYQQSLEEQGINEGSEEYDDNVAKWLADNLRITLKQNFYDDRQKILDRVDEILSKLPDSEKKEVEIGALWKDIINMTYGFRDDDGQPIGSDMTEGKVANIKAVQEKIKLAQEKYTKLSGLSSIEQDELNSLFDIKSAGESYTEDERNRLVELLDKKGRIKAFISELEFTELFKLFESLKDMQSKVPTDYYLDIMNNWLSKMSEPAMTADAADEFLNEANIHHLFTKSTEFKIWFLKNHIKIERWDESEQDMVPGYQRLYVWNRIIPNDPKYYHTYKLSNGKQLLGTPTGDYFKRVVKDEFKTGYDPVSKEVKPIVGVHIDNMRNYLPKSRQQGQNQPDWDPKYINQDYEKLQSSDSSVFKILSIMTKYHLASQEGAEYNNRLYLDVPRFRNHRLEYLQSGKLKSDISSGASRLAGGVKSVFTKQKDDFQEGQNNFESEMNERLVNTDIFNNEMVKIPIKGISNIPVDQVSMDVGGSIMRYIESIETNKQLVKINPIAEALLDTVEENGVKKIDGINRKLFLNTGLKSLVNDTKNNRHQILENLYERVFLGVENKMEIGEFGNKAANQLMRFSAFGSLLLNVPGAFKNMFAAQVQGFIEGMGGQHITMNEYRKGLNEMSIKFIPAMVKDYNEFGDHSYETQLMRMFDFVQGKTEEKFGQEYTGATSRNFVTGKFGFFGLAAGEIEAQGGFGLGLLMHQKVQQTIGNDTKEIMYKDAWFKDTDGKIKLKEGIDPEWGEGGKKFNQFKLLGHELSQKLQGNYAKIDQPEMQRYTLLRLLSFMRRYFVPAFSNRLSKDRIQVGVNGSREGYYLTTLRIFRNTLRDHKANWNLYTNEEKANFYKTLGEVAISLMFYLLLRAFGWNPDDKDKYKKLKENSWLTNHFIYQLMAIKSEEEQFIPIPGMGMDELMRIKNTPSIAFGHMDKWYKLLTDVTAPLDTLDKDQGFWKKGDNKLLIQLSKIAGFTGGTIDPEVAIKNFSTMQSRVK